MAFQRTTFQSFNRLLKNTSENAHPELRAVAENFILEERLTEQREDSYDAYANSPVKIGDWSNGHGEYLYNEINVLSGTPETFTDLNKPNIFPEIDENQYLVRLDDIKRPSGISGHDVNEMVDYLNKYIIKDAQRDDIQIIEQFLDKWNKERDRRPIFAGFWGEVKDIFTDSGGKEINNSDWANQLRDRFGLGHLDPLDGEPIPVLLLRYRVRDVLAASSGDTKIAAVPTVLDSDWSPFFCPTPVKEFKEGQTLNLSPGDENDYSFNCEIIHRFIAYKTSFLYRVGRITKSPGKTCEEARKIHLSFLQGDYKNFDKIKRH